jgi:hypothetical protein
MHQLEFPASNAIAEFIYIAGRAPLRRRSAWGLLKWKGKDLLPNNAAFHNQHCNSCPNKWVSEE